VYGEQGWRQVELSETASTAQIRLVMTGEAGGLGEVEFWGYGPEGGDRHYPIAGVYPQVMDEDLNLEFEVPEDYGPYTPVTSLKVLYQSTNPSSITNSIQHRVRLVNNGKTPIDLSAVKIKYWYSKEPTTSERAQIYWATVGSRNVTTDLVAAETAGPDADHCLV
ncbi:MAG TPA: hypothetical protein DEB05_09735, partial [Firmicutes bacterium]|nr:hypothetical protein [Bacillota bacterium]